MNDQTVKPQGFYLYQEHVGILRRLSPRRAGLLIQAVCDYFESGKIPADETLASLIIPFQLSIEKGKIKYSGKVAQSRRAVNIRWGKSKNSEAKKDTSVYERIRTNTKHTNSNSNSNYIREDTGRINNQQLVQEIWEHYLQASGTKELLLPARKALIVHRLAKFSAPDIKQAITNCFADKFYSGNNDRHWRADASYVFRSDEIIDKLLNLKKPEEKVTWRNAPYD